MTQNPFDDKSTLVQAMNWCRKATKHYLKQSWPKSIGNNKSKYVMHLLNWSVFYGKQGLNQNDDDYDDDDIMKMITITMMIVIMIKVINIMIMMMIINTYITTSPISWYLAEPFMENRTGANVVKDIWLDLAASFIQVWHPKCSNLMLG